MHYQNRDRCCPARGCKLVIPQSLFMCGGHWRMVPANLQRRIWGTYKHYNRLKGSCVGAAVVKAALEELRQAQLAGYFAAAVNEGLLTRQQPGVYIATDDRSMLLEVRELLEAAGYEDNAANREKLVNQARETFAEAGVPMECAPFPEGGR